jgi:uncharacterized LabA/DUF88 family protein
MRTIVYIDGLNLYYRALKGTPHKWLDVAALSAAVLPDTCQIESIKYYTAHVSGRLDPESPKRQHSYLRAIATLPNIKLYYGNFIYNQKWAGLVQPPTFQPQVTLLAEQKPDVAYVWKAEEKGSDVNLGVHLVRDAFMKKFDMAAVLTNDTDLVEPIRIVTQELNIPVTLLTPIPKGKGRTSKSLENVATSVRHIQPYISPCQLPDLIQIQGKKPISKPATW